jgi:hypothetical protein
VSWEGPGSDSESGSIPRQVLVKLMVKVKVRIKISIRITIRFMAILVLETGP